MNANNVDMQHCITGVLLVTCRSETNADVLVQMKWNARVLF